MDEEQRLAIAREVAEEFSKMVLVYAPPLAVTLGRYERGEGRPLTREEVYYLRDTEFCQYLTPEEARLIETARGYPDVGYETCWEDWQRLRREIGLA